MVFELYSKRQKKLRGGASDVYVYDEFPRQFKVQVVHIWNTIFGERAAHPGPNEACNFIARVLKEEYGVFNLTQISYGDSDYDELKKFFIEKDDSEALLDVIELSFRVIDKAGRRSGFNSRYNASEYASHAIADLNTRFQEHSLGYSFTDEQIVRIDSELIHEEIVKPTLRLLNVDHLSGAEDEYLKAHEHYRHGNAKEAMTECLKSIESAIKGICEKRGWDYDPKANAKTLIAVCFEKGLIPDFWQSHFTGLRAMLEGGVPTGRNKLAAHGQGAAPTEVPRYLVSYMMHMTASTLKFLAEADETLP
jgi:hypothetical protein